MKLKRRSFIKLMAMLLALLLFTACAKEKKPSASDDPNLGLWQATLVEMFGEESPADEIFEIGFEIELLEGGKCKVITDGKKGSFDWSIKGDILSISQKGNTFLTAVIKGTQMVIDDYMSTGMKITLHKEGSAPQITDPVKTEPDDPDPSVNDPDPDEPGTAVQTLWNGDWYGYLWITEYYGLWLPEEDAEEEIYDALMYIDVDEAGNGQLSINLVGAEDDIAVSTIRGDEYLLETVEGYFLDALLEEGDWWMGISPIDEGKKLVISDRYYDPELTDGDGFEYMFAFRPWGELWEAEEREGDRLPPSYESYKEDIAGEVDPPIDDPNQGWEGKVANFTNDDLEEIYALLKSDYDKGELRGMTYRDICETYFDGAAGELDLEGETISFYIWRASDKTSNYIQVTFQDYEGNGIRTAGGIGYNFE
ncbi:MAG: hypothetical protein GX034_01460 [Clostridiaceae bacterium]|nr:hypothetical protein [Clostridiaceae bacterium]